MCILRDYGICRSKYCIGKRECSLRRYFLEEQKWNRRLLSMCRPGSEAYDIIYEKVYFYRKGKGKL